MQVEENEDEYNRLLHSFCCQTQFIIHFWKIPALSNLNTH
jgi:hypothetical protein